MLALLAGLDSSTPIEVIRHAIFVTGLGPLCAWLLVVFCTQCQGVMKMFSLAMIITVYHFVLFAVSAHYDGFSYWGLQFGEFALLWVLVRKVRRNTRLFVCRDVPRCHPN